ncbi:hypothetical protein GOP47_0012774 [Adiantum capillus-veneris]|uniref:Uncharacterized protein n=1 Tax=Adiantum capillus-veneris TaxID=13818 RepID=A0A9D4ZEM2_ADICA|nr:hypothetical protein GOP47_0012774 [Adiantum capillus-veneris]
MAAHCCSTMSHATSGLHLRCGSVCAGPHADVLLLPFHFSRVRAMSMKALFKLLKPSFSKKQSLGAPSNRVAHLPDFSDELVTIQLGDRAGDLAVITINCLDRVGLTCDAARRLFEFGLDVVQADFLTDGQWCLLLFWKYYSLQTCSAERLGLLNDLSCALRELELEILNVHALTSPNGLAVIVILVSDSRKGSQDERQQAICDNVKCVLGPSYSHCELTPATMDDVGEVLDLELLYGVPNNFLEEDDSDIVAGSDKNFSANIDNLQSANHTLLQITARDRRGLLYDCMRVLNDYNLKIAYGRFKTVSMGFVAFDLLISQANGNKLLDLDKQKSLQARLRVDMCNPLRMMIVDKGRNTEVFVATTVEKSGRSRPSMMHDVTLVLKMLGVSIFQANSEKLCIGERMWEMYRFLLVESPSSSARGDQMRSHIVKRVKNVLSG